MRRALRGAAPIVLVMLLAGVASGGEGPAIRKVVVALPFEEVELIVTSEAQQRNLNLVNVMDIRKGMENRGGTFRKYKIYQFCNLELGVRILAESLDYGAFQLCSIVIYEVDASRTALVSARQTWVVQALPDSPPSPAALALARQFERIIGEIFDAVVEEARVKGR